ncbi:MAG TPA: phosphatase PAP2 family protein [Rhizomicrobium sp.]|nr:phosphatase PAP2 family protein [Rhizomicrobium sp.]
MKAATRLAGIVLAAGLAFAGPAEARSGTVQLSPDQVDASLLLPPPPAPGSPDALSEIAELKDIAAHRTAAEFEQAARDAGDESGAFFASAIGPGFDFAKLPATAQMLADIGATEDAVNKGAKEFFRRDRPWIVIADWQTCTPHKPGPAQNSYPSGHATVGYAMGVVLAALMPEKAQAILARAGTFAENRLVCGAHFRSDIVAGEVLGTVIAIDLLRSPDFRKEYDAAAAELAAAHLRPGN